MGGLRIGIEVSKLAGPSDGISTYTEMLVRTLREIDNESEYWLLTGGNAEEVERRCHEAGFSQDSGFQVRCALAEWPERLDILHCPALEVPPHDRWPWVFTLHDLTVISHAGLHTCENRLAALLATTRAVCDAAAIIAVSEHTRSQAAELLALDPARLEVIPHGVDPVFSPTPQAEDLEGLALEQPYVLAVGTLEPRKNLTGLLQAMALLPEPQRQRLTLAVAGPRGWLDDEITRCLDQARSQLNLALLGTVTRPQLSALYRHAEVFVYPSFAEGFGLPVLEAMACGAPVVTSDCSSLPEVVGSAGLLVDPHRPASIAEAIATVVEQEAVQARARKHSVEQAAKFSWRATASRTLELYRRVAHRGRG